MGLKSKLSKMKNFLFDDEEVEEEVVVKKPKKKEHEKKKDKKEVVEPKKSIIKEPEYDDYLYDISDVKSETVEVPTISRTEKTEFKMPEFNDDDFMVPSNKKPVVEEKKTPVFEEKPVLYQGSRKRKEETKKFKPSPFISPVFGLLDSHGNKVSENSEEAVEIRGKKEEITFDDIRKKAYGALDDELEDTLKKLSSKTIEEAENDMIKREEKLSRTEKKEKEEKKKEVFSSVEITKEEKNEEDDDDMILPNVNFKEIDVDEERNKSKKTVNKKKEVSKVEDDDDDYTKEQDLFNLIDTMYSKEGEE